MTTVTERTFWIEWMKKQHEEKFHKALKDMPIAEQNKVRSKAKAAWAREHDVVAELKKLDALKEKSQDINELLQKNSRAQEAMKVLVAEKKGFHGAYQAGNFMDEWKQSENAAIQAAALKKAGIDSLDQAGIEAVLMAATTNTQLLKAVEKLAAALGVKIPNV